MYRPSFSNFLSLFYFFCLPTLSPPLFLSFFFHVSPFSLSFEPCFSFTPHFVSLFFLTINASDFLSSSFLPPSVLLSFIFLTLNLPSLFISLSDFFSFSVILFSLFFSFLSFSNCFFIFLYLSLSLALFPFIPHFFITFDLFLFLYVLKFHSLFISLFLCISLCTYLFFFFSLSLFLLFFCCISFSLFIDPFSLTLCNSLLFLYISSFLSFFLPICIF
ncbi:unnamed protein product [Acanthosepion pharaonis]|uniref:Uncharacterized protein n=1 Tax=Acanthosepion pharaonis TaxID=158019 RepID=A0A812EWE0_ACAPH|nr:unnamed protein product [Sepia pharaonis]